MFLVKYHEAHCERLIFEFIINIVEWISKMYSFKL